MRIAAALICILPAIAPAQPQIGMSGFVLPYGSLAAGMTAGSDGAEWFTDYNATKIGRVTPAGTITEYAIPTPGSGPEGIATGSDAALWFAEFRGNNIGRITTAGAVTEYALPFAESHPSSIAAGPDGALWFTEITNKIGRITTAGAITEFPVPGNDTLPFVITAGPDAAMWFVAGTSAIGRITTEGAITLYPIPDDTSPGGITAGPDGALWFTGYFGQIFRMTTDGAYTEYPAPGFLLMQIVIGPDDALWFSEFSGDIGRITTEGVVTQYPMPAGASANFMAGIAAGPYGELWFGQNILSGSYSNQQIGYAVFETASLTVTPDAGYYKSQLTFTGSGFAPNETVHICTRGPGSELLASVAADASGSFTASAAAPPSPYGPRIFIAVGQSSNKLGAANFSMSPRLILNPRSGPVDSTVTATGFGFQPFDQIEIEWNNPRTVLGTVTADDHGTFAGSAALTFTVPSGAPPGANAVFGHSAATKTTGTGSFNVE